MSQDEAEFQKIYADFHPRIQRYLTRMVGEEESEDLTQEVFTKVSRGVADFRGESTLSTWIYRIATHAAIDRLRSASYQQKRRERSFDESFEQEGVEFVGREMGSGRVALPVEQELVRRQMNECIRAFIERLPENYRTALVLSELEGFSNREIVEILDVSLHTVKIRLHRAREKLRVELETHCDAYWVEENEFLPDLRDALKEYKKMN